MLEAEVVQRHMEIGSTSLIHCRRLARDRVHRPARESSRLLNNVLLSRAGQERASGADPPALGSRRGWNCHDHSISGGH